MMKTFTTLLMLPILNLSQPCLASSTFVGNGGSSQDLELQVSLSQLKDLTQVIQIKYLNLSQNQSQAQDSAQAQTQIKVQDLSSANLCVCSGEFSDYDFCKILESLTLEQKKYCSSFVKKQNPILAKLLNSNQVQIHFTNDILQIQNEDENRVVEAIANAKDNSITIQEKKFGKLKSHERIFLLAHEFYHLTDIDGKYIVDHQSYGAFDSKDGGKKLLNAAAAAQTQLAFQNSVISHYSSVINRSRYKKYNYFSTGIFNRQSDVQNSNSFGFKEENGFEFKYRFQPSVLGFSVSSWTSQSQRKMYNTVNLNESKSSTLLGLTLRFPIIKDSPETFWGQAHYFYDFGVELLNGKYTIKDNYISLTEKARSSSPYLGVSFYIPLRHGVWFYSNLYLYSSKLNYKEIDLKTNSRYSLNLGVSYGF